MGVFDFLKFGSSRQIAQELKEEMIALQKIKEALNHIKKAERCFWGKYPDLDFIKPRVGARLFIRSTPQEIDLNYETGVKKFQNHIHIADEALIIALQHTQKIEELTQRIIAALKASRKTLPLGSGRTIATLDDLAAEQREIVTFTLEATQKLRDAKTKLEILDNLRSEWSYDISNDQNLICRVSMKELRMPSGAPTVSVRVVLYYLNKELDTYVIANLLNNGTFLA